MSSLSLRQTASALVVDYGPDVLATCTAMLRDRAAAEDVTQEVFSDAIRALSTFRGDASPRTWLLSIARNRCIDYLRARKREPWGATSPDDDANDPDAHPDKGALGSEWLADRSVVVRALDVLAEGDRALVVLRFKNGLEYDELASAFGLKEGTVRMRVSRALAKMRTVLESENAAPAPPPAMAAPMAPMGAAAPMRARAAFAAPEAPSVSWWSRLRAWAIGDERSVPAPRAPTPIGALGLSLTRIEPATPSDALAGRLAALVDAMAP